VFYVRQAAVSLHETALEIQSKTHAAGVVCTYNAPKAIVVRGTAQQIAQAAQLIEHQDN
jgi:acyl transferase domain-containing protein